MVGIGAYIRNTKEKFLSVRNSNKERVLKDEVENMKLERDRQAKLEKINKEKAKLASEVTRMKTFNKKVEGPSRMQKIAEGLAKMQARKKQKDATRQTKDVFGFGNSSNAPMSKPAEDNYNEVIITRTVKRNKPIKQEMKKSPFNFGK